MRKGTKNAQIHQQVWSPGGHADLRDPLERESVQADVELARAMELDVGVVRNLKKK